MLYISEFWIVLGTVYKYCWGTIVFFWIVFGSVYKHCWGHNCFFGLPLGQCTSIVGHNCFFGLSLGQCTSIVGHNCFLDCLWDSVQALLGHNCFFGLSLGQCTSIVRAQLFFWIVFGTVYQHCWGTIVKLQSRLVVVVWCAEMCQWHRLTDEACTLLATLSQK